MILNEIEGVLYELFDISELHQMALITAEAFAQYEPITSSLHIPSETFMDFVRLRWPNPYLTHTINIHLKTICYVIKNLRVALRLEK